MSSLNQANQSAELFIQGCGYRIENDRVIISIECIGNNRAENNTSGTLRIQLCALSPNANEFDNNILASTTIGEVKGQHFIPNCHYDLVFQPPSTGSWKLAIQLSEWDGIDYVLCDTVYFESPYQIFANSDHYEITERPSNTTVNISLSNQPVNRSDALKQDTAPKVTINTTEHYLVINKLKAKKLLDINGIPKKVLERLVAERPFQSEKAILSVKGMGPIMLKKLLTILMG